MRFSWPLLALLAIACSDETSAPQTCFAAGGSCILGGVSCSKPGTQDCTLDGIPAGYLCCLSCSASDAGPECY